MRSAASPYLMGSTLRIAAGLLLASLLPVRADVTFLHISDQHYGAKQFDPSILQNTIDAMNAIPGTPYPDKVGGKVGTPLGVILTGDLTDGGQPGQWQLWAADWGLTGKEGRVKFPVYEGAGNHDGAPSTRASGDGPGYVRRQIIERNRTRPGVVNRSANGLHYSWDWEELHLVCLNEYAGLDGTERYAGNAAYNRKTLQYGNPSEQSLQFLQQDLAARVGKSGRPVILTQHYGFDPFTFHPWGDKAAWWTEEHALRLWETIEGYNVIAILNGHDGSEAVFDWHGIKNYHMDDNVRFGVYHVAGNRMTMAQRNSKSGAWEASYEQTTQVNSSLPPELTGGPYLVYGGDPSRMTVAWRCNTNAAVKLHWGRDYFRYEGGAAVVQQADAVHHVYQYELGGLPADSRVNFALEINGKYAPGMFYTPPAGGMSGTNKVKFLALGGVPLDTATRDRLHQAMYEQLYTDAAYHTFLLHTGPLPEAEFGTRDAANKHARYLQSRLPVLGPLASQESPERGTPYAGGKSSSRSFDYGPVHAVVLDLAEDWSTGSKAHQWLKTDLESTTNSWKFLVLGPGAKGQKPATRTAQLMQQLQELCEAAGVDVCLDGWEQGFSHKPVNGLMTVTLGSTAQGTPTASTPAPFYCAITVAGDQLTVQALGLDGKVADSFSMKDVPGTKATTASAK